MAITSLQAANKICEYCGWDVSNLRLQKLLYIAHKVFLGRYNKPLIADKFEAWDYGPVVPKLYHKLKMFGRDPIDDVFRLWDIEGIEDEQVEAFIEEACDALSAQTAGQLVAMTHHDEGAWAKHYRPGGRGVMIPNDDIQEEYNQLNAA